MILTTFSRVMIKYFFPDWCTYNRGTLVTKRTVDTSRTLWYFLMRSLHIMSE